MTNFLDIPAAARKLGVTPRHLRRLCKAGELTGAQKNFGRWEVPVTADAQLAGVKTAEQLSDSDELARLPRHKREQALKRLGLIKGFDRFAPGYLALGHTRSQALTVFAAQHKIALRSFQRWMSKYREFGLIGLVDTRGGGLTSLTETISPEAMDYFNSFYLTPRQPSVTQCLDFVNFLNQTEGRGWAVPKLTTLYKLVERIPKSVKVLRREGLSAYEAQCAPYIERDPDSVEPGEIWVGDHHEFNCWVRYHNEWVRPWITAWSDMRSRTLLGWWISAAPNQTTILLSIKRAIESHGPPDMAKIDNGKDYDSQMFTGTTKKRRREALKKGYLDEQMVAGIYAMLDIAVSFSIPYHPQSKPIERFFHTIDMQLCKTIDTYCGKDAARRPADLYKWMQTDKAIAGGYSMNTFNELVGRYIESVYNHAPHQGIGMEGQTPLAVLSQRTRRRVVADGVLDLMMRVWSGKLKVGKNGVHFNKINYGQYDPTLLAAKGREVRVAYDPDHRETVYVYDATTLKLMTIAENNQLVRYGRVGEEDVREAMKQKNRAKKVAKDYANSHLTRNMDLPNLAIAAAAARNAESQIPAPEPTPMTLRPVATAFDGQVTHHQKMELKRTLKKAAGGESHEMELDMDLSALQGASRTATRKVNLFDR